MVRALSSNYEDFAGASRPFRAQVEIDDLEVEGDIPRELRGTFFRVNSTGSPSGLCPRQHRFLTRFDV